MLPNSKVCMNHYGIRAEGNQELIFTIKYLFFSIQSKLCDLLFLGGALIFDDADLHLQAENILITDGGLLQVKSFPSVKLRLRSRKFKGECQILFLVFIIGRIFGSTWSISYPKIT